MKDRKPPSAFWQGIDETVLNLANLIFEYSKTQPELVKNRKWVMQLLKRNYPLNPRSEALANSIRASYTLRLAEITGETSNEAISSN